MKHYALHQFPDRDVYLEPDKREFPSCKQCVLDSNSCNYPCLIEGTRYHVSKVVKYNFFQRVVRRIQIFFKRKHLK